MTTCDKVALAGWGFTEQSIRVTKPNGFTFLVTLDRATTEFLAGEFALRAERMVDENG